MSLKTRILLHRTGRNEFGDFGQPPLPRHKPSRAERARDKRLVEEHRAENARFVERYAAAWLRRFEGLSKEEAWKQIYPHGRPALSTFRVRSREFPSFADFLVFVLVSEKRAALRLMGHSPVAIAKVMHPFGECGRYMVTYGHSRREFSSI